MRVSESEKEVVEEAARRINAQIGHFKATYHTQDDVNIVIMACVKFASDAIRKGHESEQSQYDLQQALVELEEQLNVTLKSE